MAESRRITTRAVLLAAALVLGVVVLVLVALRPSEASSRFCTLDGLASENVEVYVRDANQDCQFVDGDGNVIGG